MPGLPHSVDGAAEARRPSVSRIVSPAARRLERPRDDTAGHDRRLGQPEGRDRVAGVGLGIFRARGGCREPQALLERRGGGIAAFVGLGAIVALFASAFNTMAGVEFEAGYVSAAALFGLAAVWQAVVTIRRLRARRLASPVTSPPQARFR